VHPEGLRKGYALSRKGQGGFRLPLPALELLFPGGAATKVATPLPVILAEAEPAHQAVDAEDR